MATATQPPKTLGFEKTTCTRCGGSGRYSYCQTMKGPHGPWSCFKCGGYGEYRTKAGQAAYELFVRALSKPARELVPGDFVKARGSRGSHEVKFVKWDTEEDNFGYSLLKDGSKRFYFRVVTTACTHGILDDGELWRVAASGERKAKVHALCHEYESLLTKSGKESKHKAKAERIAEIKAELGVTS